MSPITSEYDYELKAREALDDESEGMPRVRRYQLGIFPPEIDFRFPMRKPVTRA
nr:hypothetical protein [Candidatus Sigynarchaeota archaeon]